MAIDLTQFHQLFFEESLEGLALLESGLLAMQPGAVQKEEINALFRAAHSIKGGSSTFGFKQVAEFTHLLETLLAQMRDGHYQLTDTVRKILLDSVDVLRMILTAARGAGSIDEAWVRLQQRALGTALDAMTSQRTDDHRDAPAEGQEIGAGYAHTAPLVELEDSSACSIPERRSGEDRRKQTRRVDERRAPQFFSGDSIRVDINKVDRLINIAGELVIAQSALVLLGEDFSSGDLDRLREGLDQLARHTRELQESVMQIRMLPIGTLFSRFPRLVHELSAQLGKKVELRIYGGHTELDKNLLEKISDPLVHLVRNSLDHGIELPAERSAADKPGSGTITLNAFHQGGNIIIEIGDDGRGIDPELIIRKAIALGMIDAGVSLNRQQAFELIFQAGFSTAEQISDLSGRGVGMDVVRRNVNELGGYVEIESEIGQGSLVNIRLPLTLAVLDGQTVAVGDEIYVIPLLSIIESIQLVPEMVNSTAGRGESCKVREETLSIIRLAEVFGIAHYRASALSDGLVVVVEGDGRRCAILVDELLGQQQLVIKSLETNYERVDGVSGATILGDGSVALILDIPGIMRLAQQTPEPRMQRCQA